MFLYIYFPPQKIIFVFATNNFTLQSYCILSNIFIELTFSI